MTAYVRALGVTHVLVDLEGMSFLLQHDPTGAHRLAARFLTESYAPACLAPIFSAPKVTLFLLRCQ
jgi:hypothetical protein